MTTKETSAEVPQNAGLAREIAVQAELLALNFALEGRGAGQASDALSTLARDLREAMGPRNGLRLEPKR